MKRIPSTSLGKLALSAIALATLAGCATVSLEQNVARVNEEAKSFAEGQISLARTADERGLYIVVILCVAKVKNSF